MLKLKFKKKEKKKVCFIKHNVQCYNCIVYRTNQLRVINL